MSVSGSKHILFVSMLVVSFVAFGEEPKTQVVKADTLINDDVLVGDLDEDILSVSKNAPKDTSKADTAKTGTVKSVSSNDTAKNVSSKSVSSNDTAKNVSSKSVSSNDTAKNVSSKSATSNDTTKSVSPVIIKESDEVLILDGGAEDLLGAAKVGKTADSSSKPVQQVESSKIQGESQSSDSIAAKVSESKTTRSVSAPAKVSAQTPAKIEATNSINFARNLKEYRSPKIAMLLSFLLPGAGEIYAKNGVRAATFGLVEAGIIAAGVVFSVKAKNQTDEAYRFADQHYSVDQFKKYYNTLKNKFPTTVDTLFNSNYYDFQPLNFSKNTSDYNDLIGREADPFVQGWDDVTPRFGDNFELSDTSYHRNPKGTDSTYDSSYLVFTGNDTINRTLAYGFSDNQKVYNSKLSKGGKTYKVSKNIFTLLLINHVISAIDAGICAKAYNDKLLGKQSLWQRINIKEIAVNSGSGTASGYALEVRF